MPTIWTEVEIDVDLAEFETEELVAELESRDQVYKSNTQSIVQQMYDDQRLDRDIQPLLKELYWNMLGRVL